MSPDNNCAMYKTARSTRSIAQSFNCLSSPIPSPLPHVGKEILSVETAERNKNLKLKSEIEK